jgi:hypothetical protein
MTSLPRSGTPPALPLEPPSAPVIGPPEQWPALPPPPADPPSPARGWAAVFMCWLGTIVATVAVFGPWAHYADGTNKTGIEHGDGWIVLAVALVAAALTGMVAFGARHPFVRIGLAATAAVLVLLYTINRIDVARSKDRVTGARIDVGGGLFAVALAACCLFIGALITPPDRPPRGDPPASA